MICCFLLTNETCLYKFCLTFLQHLTQLITLSLHTVSTLTLDLLILSSSGFDLISLIGNTVSLYQVIIVIIALTLSNIGLPLGSVLGPIIFSMCVIFVVYYDWFTHHSFADDLQWQIYASPSKTFRERPMF